MLGVKNINFFKYIKEDLSESLLKSNYYSNGINLKLFSDDRKLIDVVDEMLKPHFCLREFYNEEILKSDIEVYSINLSNIEIVEKEFFCKSKVYSWKKIKHMGNFYFYTRFFDSYGIALWPSEKHAMFGDENISVDSLIAEYLLGNNNLNVIIYDLKKSFIHLYNNLDNYIVMTPVRLIRSLFAKKFLENNFLFFHAAAVKYKNKGILFTGKRDSGKTSILLDFLNKKKGYMIANDKVFIGLDANSKLRVWGWPTVVNLGVGSLNKYSQLRKFLTSLDGVTCTQWGYTPNADYLKLSPSQMKNLNKTGGENRGKFTISNKQLIDLFNTSIISDFKIDIIVAVNLKWDCIHKNIRKLDIKEKETIIQNNIIIDTPDQLEWLGYPLMLENNDAPAVIHNIVNNICVYEYTSDFQDEKLTNFLDDIIA